MRGKKQERADKNQREKEEKRSWDKKSLALIEEGLKKLKQAKEDEEEGAVGADVVGTEERALFGCCWEQQRSCQSPQKERSSVQQSWRRLEWKGYREEEEEAEQ